MAGQNGSYGMVNGKVARWLAEYCNPKLTVAGWWSQFAESRRGFRTWPSEWCGRGLKPLFCEAVPEAFQPARGLGPPSSVVQLLGAPTLVLHVPECQRQGFVPTLARGEAFWCQLFSEPGVGSDLASLQTATVLGGDIFVVNGQRVWTSGVQWADGGMLVDRTNKEVPMHRGITCSVIDMDQPEIEVQPFHQRNGPHGFNGVCFVEARVDSDRVVGNIDKGSTVVLTTLAFERFMSSFRASPGRKVGLLGRSAGDIVCGPYVDPRAGVFSESELAELSIPVTAPRRANRYPLALQYPAPCLALRSCSGSLLCDRPPQRKLSGVPWGRVRCASLLDLASSAQLGKSGWGSLGRTIRSRTTISSLRVGFTKWGACVRPTQSQVGRTRSSTRSSGSGWLSLAREPQVDRETLFRNSASPRSPRQRQEFLVRRRDEHG